MSQLHKIVLFSMDEDNTEEKDYLRELGYVDAVEICNDHGWKIDIDGELWAIDIREE